MDEPLDPAVLDEIRALGGEKLLRKVVALFLEHTPHRLSELCEASASGDTTAAAAAAHALRSSAGNVGARKLHVLLTSTEEAAREGRPGEVAALEDAVSAAHAEACAALRLLAGPAS